MPPSTAPARPPLSPVFELHHVPVRVAGADEGPLSTAFVEDTSPVSLSLCSAMSCRCSGGRGLVLTGIDQLIGEQVGERDAGWN